VPHHAKENLALQGALRGAGLQAAWLPLHGECPTSLCMGFQQVLCEALAFWVPSLEGRK
jgi:hypothetical protein